MSSVAERIAEHAMFVSEGNIKPVIEWLHSVGRKAEMYGETVIINGVNDTRIGLLIGSDPITSVVQILFALYGMYWTSIEGCTKAMDIVNKKWKAKVKKTKEETKVRTGNQSMLTEFFEVYEK